MDSQNQGETKPVELPDKRTKLLMASAAVSLVILLAILIISNQVVYAVIVDGKTIGNVKDKEILEEIKRELESYQQEHLGSPVQFDQAIELAEVKAWGNEVSTKEEIKKELENLLSVRVRAVSIEIEGVRVGVVKDEATAQAALQEVKDYYIDQTPGELIKVEVAESVKLAECYVAPDEVQSQEDITELILRGTLEYRSYVVEAGDSLWSIAQREGMDVEDLIKANPQLKDANRLALGDELNLTEVKPLLNVKVVKNLTYEEDIQYATRTERDSSMWKWDKKVKNPGELGKKEIVSEVSYVNGVKTDSQVLSEKVIKEPVDRVVVQGTKAEVAFRGTGRFAWPITGQITSGFGRRGSEFHTGIDICASRGTPIYASNSGTVTFAGRSGGYGNLVIIDHGGGFSTYYAHTNSYSVKKGDQVQKGQVIATVGSTGRSTGPHLHFEIRVGGTPKNPLSYLGK